MATWHDPHLGEPAPHVDEPDPDRWAKPLRWDSAAASIALGLFCIVVFVFVIAPWIAGWFS